MPSWLKYWSTLSKADHYRLVFITLMQAAFVFASFIAIYEKAWLTLFISIIALGLVWLPYMLEKNFSIHFPMEFALLLNIFIYSSIFLGEMQSFYAKFWWWDIVLHTGSGIALGFIGFLILFSLLRSNRLSMKPSLLTVFSFCFAIALGALWEIFEFAMDSFFGFNMQKTGLRDTMWDMIVNTVGALIASISGYVYLRYGWRGVGIFEHYLNVFFAKNAQ